MVNKMKTKREKNDTRRVNEKYVKLVSTIYVNYKDLTILERREEINSHQGEKETTAIVINAPKIVQSNSNYNLDEKLGTKRKRKKTPFLGLDLIDPRSSYTLY